MADPFGHGLCFIQFLEAAAMTKLLIGMKMFPLPSNQTRPFRRPTQLFFVPPLAQTGL
jgi:hypothetical protein